MKIVSENAFADDLVQNTMIYILVMIGSTLMRNTSSYHCWMIWIDVASTIGVVSYLLYYTNISASLVLRKNDRLVGVCY